MYAVIRTGGKQYKVQTGDLLKVEKLEKSLGDEFEMNEVLFVAGKTTHVGEPTVSNAKVTVVVTSQSKAPKVIVFKRKRRQGYRRFNGHRQPFTELFVKSIVAPDGEADTTQKLAPVKDPAKSLEAKAAAQSQRSKVAPGEESVSAKKTVKKKTGKTAAKKASAEKAPAKKAVTKKTTKKKTSKKTL